MKTLKMTTMMNSNKSAAIRMLYWLLMMIIMVVISNNDKLQIVSANCVRRLIQTMIWLTICEFYQTLWPYLIRRIALAAHPVSGPPVTGQLMSASATTTAAAIILQQGEPRTTTTAPITTVQQEFTTTAALTTLIMNGRLPPLDYLATTRRAAR